LKVYISVDLEGIAGVSHPDPTGRHDRGYEAAVALMAGETNAAIEGAIAGGATDVLVNDSHGSMYNLRPADLDARARLLQGQKVWTMVAGAGPPEPGEAPRFDVALFIGYHARAGHPIGTLAHTYTLRLVETRLNGRATGEYGLNAAVLGAWGIPVGLVAGDDALAGEVTEWLPWAERVIVKEAAGGNAAASLHPSVAQDLVRKAAQQALQRAAAKELTILHLPSPVSFDVDFRRAIEADLAALVPGSERVGDRTVRFIGADPVSAYRAFCAGIYVADAAE
jgi:D-amino peptidase